MQLNIKCTQKGVRAKMCDLRDFECGVIVGGRNAGSSVGEAADFLPFSHTTVSRVYRKWCNKQKSIQSAETVWVKIPC